MPAERGPRRGARTQSVLFWSFVAALAVYVALVTPFRSEVLTADAWEHLSAVRTLTESLWSPANPTYANDDPSARFSPSSVALALLCNATGLTPFAALTGAAVAGIVLFYVAFWYLLRGFGRPDAAFAGAVCTTFLYGRAPGYANSFALSDLPWHAVNPSVLSMALNFFVWGLLWRAVRWPTAPRVLGTALAGVALGVSLLCHGMSGALGAVGVAGLLFAVAPRERAAHAIAVAAVAAVSFGVCVPWPWYSFLDAVRGGAGDVYYWYNREVVKQMWTLWCAPVYLLALLALPRRRQPAVRFALGVSLAALCLGLLAVGLRSASLARLPLAATPLAAIAVGVWMRDTGFLTPAWWTRTWRGLFGRVGGGNPPAVANVLVLVALGYGVWPQLRDVAVEPHLARPLIAGALGGRDLQPHLWRHYGAVTAGIEPGEVVFATRDEGWPVPSFGGRVVAAKHLELFTEGQRQRWFDTFTLFETDDPAERARLLEAYGVGSVLVSREGPRADAIVEEAVLVESGPLVRMNAERWAAGLAERR